MKKALIFILVCLFACSCVLPCVAAEKTAAQQETITLGQWPQSRVTSLIKLVELNQKLKGCSPDWQTDFLPDGRTVQYADVAVAQSSQNGLSVQTLRPTHRVVRIDGGAYQWYNWEPLTWEWVSYHGLGVLVCTSVVFVVENNDNAVITWLQDSFYRNALSAGEQSKWALCKPTHGMTNDSVAAVGAYAALYGADGSSYYQIEDPEIPEPPQPETPTFAEDPRMQREISDAGQKDSGAKGAAKAEKSTPVCTKQACKSSAFIGVRPVLVWKNQPYAGGIISWLLRLLGL
ncbi:MAG: hypothetical protein IJT41_06705 [Clostridia bacterium]|nr:hypothetical protein [Clostridia bacterium]